PLHMVGAETHFENLGHFLKQIGETSCAIAVHGGTGVGKKRFVKEAGFQAALTGLATTTVPPESFRQTLIGLNKKKDGPQGSVLFFQSLEGVPAEDMALLAELKGDLLPKRGALIVLHWNDDRLETKSRTFLNRLLQDHVLQDFFLQNL